MRLVNIASLHKIVSAVTVFSEGGHLNTVKKATATKYFFENPHANFAS